MPATKKPSKSNLRLEIQVGKERTACRETLRVLGSPCFPHTAQLSCLSSLTASVSLDLVVSSPQFLTGSAEREVLPIFYRMADQAVFEDYID